MDFQCNSLFILDVFTSPCYHRTPANVRYTRLKRTLNPFMSLANHIASGDMVLLRSHYETFREQFDQ